MKLNWNCLGEIKTTAESSCRFLEFKNNRRPKELQSIALSNDMLDIIDYIYGKRNELAFSYPSFSNNYSTFFKKYGTIYHIFQTETDLSIITNIDSASKEKLQGYSKEEFLEDYQVYYYYDLDDNKVRCFWDDLPYKITEDG